MGKLLLMGMCCVGKSVYGQSITPLSLGEYVYKQKTIPTNLENYLFSTYYYNGKKSFNLKSFVMSSVSGDILQMKINPSGTTFAVLYMKGNNSIVAIFDLWKQNSTKHLFNDISNASAICYSADARDLYISSNDKLFCYDLRNYEQKWSFDLPFTASDIVTSDNGYYIAARNGSKVVIWNLESKEIRKEYDFEVVVNDIKFSNGSDKFGVLTEDELLSLYDAHNFAIIQHFDAVGKAKCLSFHPDGKYASVISGEGRIAIINLLDGETREYIENEAGGINGAVFVKDGKQNTFLAYNSQTDIIYKLMSQLAPNYTKLLKEELAERMAEWEMRMPNETLEEYNIRVNDDTREKQMKLFAEDISTKMAGNLLEMSMISLGNYNPENNMLALEFDTMIPIFLDVPESELLSFQDVNNLEFKNVRYGLTEKDKFKLVYVDVYNRLSGKTYTYDNREGLLDHIKADNTFVPLDLVHQSSMEMMKLEEIKDNIVGIAKQQNKISDHTKITVSARVVPDVDANGKKIMNYLIRFTYTVDPKFSAKEDFGVGKYKAEESAAAISMLRIVKTAFENDFAQYAKQGKKLKVNITGMADALPITGKINYDGCYGEFLGEPVYKNSDLGNITITRKDGITENEQLAFLRATGVKEFIKSNVPSLNKMETSYIHKIELTKGKGGEYRRINVDFIFVDAF